MSLEIVILNYTPIQIEIFVQADATLSRAVYTIDAFEPDCAWVLKFNSKKLSN